MSHLQDAVAAAAAGDKNKAYVILADLLKKTPHDVEAWVALSEIVDDEKQQRTFLTRALTLDASHARARSLLQQLDTPPAPDEMAEPGLAPAAEEPDVDEAPEPDFDLALDAEEPAGAPAADDTMVMPPEEVDALRQQATSQQDDTVVDARPISMESDDFDLQASGETIPPWLMGDGGQLLPEAEALEADLPELDEESEVPDWLQDDLGEEWEDEPAAVAPAAAAPQPAAQPTAITPRKPAKAASARSQKQLDRIFRWLMLAFVIMGVVVLYLLYQVIIQLNLF